MIRRILTAFGLFAWGGLSFLLGLYVTFPSDPAVAFLSYQAGELSKHDYAVDMGSVSPWIFPGLRATEVKVYTVKKGRKTKDDPVAPLVRTVFVEADAVALRMQLIPRLMGKWAFSFSADLYGGDVGGRVALGETSTELAFDASGIDLTRFPIQNNTTTVNLLGTLSSEADLAFDLEDTKQSTGHLDLSFEGFGIGEGSNVSGFTLPNVSFTKAKAAMKVEDGKISVEEGTFESEQLTATLTGDINLAKKLARSRCKLELVFSLPEDLDKLAQIAPDLKRARDKEGLYHFVIGGTISSPSFRPGRGASSSLRDKEGPGLEGPGILGDGPPLLRGGGEEGDPEETAEERRRRREERIKERRERMKKRRDEARLRDEEEGGPEEPDDEPPGMDEEPPDDDGPPGMEDGPGPGPGPGRRPPPDMPPPDMMPPDMMPPEGFEPGMEQ